MKVALVYDRINKFGGAERVLLALHQLYPDAPLYTSVYDKRLTPWADVFDVRTSFLQKLPLPKNKHEYYPFLMGLAFETINFDQYDLVISVTHEFAKVIVTKPKTLHLCYCLTPTGYLWSGYHQYFSGRPDWFRLLSRPVVAYLRWYDKIVAQRPDSYVAISKTVQKRIKKYYGRDSEVIYPPINLAPQAKPRSARFLSEAKGSYFLVVSRLVPNKRVDVVVRAFNHLELPLLIIGSGTEEDKLKSLAKDNIKFLSHLTDDELAGYYTSCRAVVIAGEEDFNIVAVEAQSFGRPVVAYSAGGVTETVIDGKTGWFFNQQTWQSLVNLIKKIDFKKIDSDDCIENARNFSLKRFKQEFEQYTQTQYRQYVRNS